MRTLMTDNNCTCKTCGCNNVCEFYAESIKPVLEVVENTVCLGTDPVATEYVGKLNKALDDFYCEYKE